jgi:hypothetical protein
MLNRIRQTAAGADKATSTVSVPRELAEAEGRLEAGVHRSEAIGAAAPASATASSPMFALARDRDVARSRQLIARLLSSQWQLRLARSPQAVALGAAPGAVCRSPWPSHKRVAHDPEAH